MKKNNRLQITLKPSAYEVFNNVKKELEGTVMEKLADSVPINKIILEWDELRKLKQEMAEVKKNKQERKTA